MILLDLLPALTHLSIDLLRETNTFFFREIDWIVSLGNWIQLVVLIANLIEEGVLHFWDYCFRGVMKITDHALVIIIVVV